MGALIGHDGFGSPPGGGSQPHYLHHALMDVNYGEASAVRWTAGCCPAGSRCAAAPLQHEFSPLRTDPPPPLARAVVRARGLADGHLRGHGGGIHGPEGARSHEETQRVRNGMPVEQNMGAVHS